MSIESEINRISTNVQETLNAIEEMGGTVPEGATSNEMPAAARTIPVGAKIDDSTPASDKTYSSQKIEGIVTQLNQANAKQDEEIAKKANDKDLAAVAKSGKYEDLSGKPDIPTVPASLPNPFPLTINGTAYDGSEEVDLTIEGGGSGGEVVDLLLEVPATTERIGQFEATLPTPTKYKKIVAKAFGKGHADNSDMGFNQALLFKNDEGEIIGCQSGAKVAKDTTGYYVRHEAELTDAYVTHNSYKSSHGWDSANNGSATPLILFEIKSNRIVKVYYSVGSGSSVSTGEPWARQTFEVGFTLKVWGVRA